MAKSKSNPDAENLLCDTRGRKGRKGESWLTVHEVAELLRVSRDTIERWINTGQLRAVNISANSRTDRASWRIPNGGLEEFLQHRSTRPIETPRRTPRNRTLGIIEFIK